jgi:hypothetical protein
MDIEIWNSSKGREEIHHFLAKNPATYVFGINRRLLGDVFYEGVLQLVRDRLLQLEKNHERQGRLVTGNVR